MHPEVKALIKHYHFQPLPVEGTLFVSTYRSAQEVEGGGPVGTAMIGLYCDEPHSLSLFHRLTTDEVWHFYGGDPLRLSQDNIHVTVEDSILRGGSQCILTVSLEKEI
ncbi:MAG: cupin domain-containing protein [Chloroflexi bacterium]|nr:cupin domain-containing protein [Chloroflexota bacterium]